MHSSYTAARNLITHSTGTFCCFCWPIRTAFTWPALITSSPKELWKYINSAGLAQWWERSPPTNVSRVLFPDPASYVSWVCCRFSTLLREVFSPGTPVFPSPHKPTFLNSNLIWIIVKHFIMSPWLGWLRKHSLFLTLKLHLHFTFLSPTLTYPSRNNNSLSKALLSTKPISSWSAFFCEILWRLF